MLAFFSLTPPFVDLEEQWSPRTWPRPGELPPPGAAWRPARRPARRGRDLSTGTAAMPPDTSKGRPSTLKWDKENDGEGSRRWRWRRRWRRGLAGNFSMQLEDFAGHLLKNFDWTKCNLPVQRQIHLLSYNSNFNFVKLLGRGWIHRCTLGKILATVYYNQRQSRWSRYYD